MSIYEARNLNHSYVGTEHVLMAILRVSDSYGVAFLQVFGVNIRDLYNECVNEVGDAKSAPQLGAIFASEAIQDADTISMRVDHRTAFDYLEA